VSTELVDDGGIVEPAVFADVVVEDALQPPRTIVGPPAQVSIAGIGVRLSQAVAPPWVELPGQRNIIPKRSIAVDRVAGVGV